MRPPIDQPADPRPPVVPRRRSRRALLALATASTLVAATSVVGVALATQTSKKPAVKAEPPPSPGTYRGPAVDVCSAPSAKQMKAWAKSPYRGIVVYIGGSSRGCKQPNLTAAWVGAQRAAGWHLIPVYVGPQASCTTANAKTRIVDSRPVAMGYEAGTDAVAQARALGLGRDSVLIYDLEHYPTDNPVCGAAALAFLSGWTVRLHDLGYLSGLYSSTASGITAAATAYDRPGFVRPDYVDFARWDGVQTLTDPVITDAQWPPRRRMKQFRGPHQETWGGVTLTVDNDYADLATLPRTRIGDFSGNGWSDLLAIQPATGAVQIYAGTGVTLARRPLTTGWRGIDAITRLGDFNRDGHEDVIARVRSTGSLWLYPGRGTGFGARIRIGISGWNAMSEITAVGDVTGDGYPDLMAVHTPTGTLRLYPGHGRTLGAKIDLTTARGELDELAGVGDLDGDGRGDLVARVKRTGVLRFYPGRARGLGAYRDISATGATLRDLVGVGDFDRDGAADLIATDATTGSWCRYPVSPQGLGTGVRLGTATAGLLLG